MKLSINGIDLATLGVLQMLGAHTQREPVEAPQRERVTVRCRLDFFERAFADNAGQVAQVRAALKTPATAVLWQDDNTTTYLNRAAIITDDDEPADGRRLSGGTRQAVTFGFFYYNHDLVTACLSAGYQPGNAGPPLDMGAVEQWEEGYDAKYFDPMRDARELVQGTLTCSGRYQANTRADAAAIQAELLAKKDAMLAGLSAGGSGTFSFGTFTQSVRVGKFSAKVNQPKNFVEWSLSATFTRYPNEANYAVLKYTVSHRVKLEEGIDHLILKGKVLAPSLVLAQAQVALLKAAVVPPSYIQETSDQDGVYAASESAANGVELTMLTGDGVVFTELDFDLSFRDTGTLVTSYQRTGSNAPPINLGVVDTFSDAYDGKFYDEMRDQRKRGGGMVTLGGTLYQPDNLPLATKQAALTAAYAQIMGELTKGSNGMLNYGSNGNNTAYAFSQRVRILNFNAKIDRLQNCIRWTLTGSYTRFPNESGYALVEYKRAFRQDKAAGTVKLSLAGRIGAPTLVAAAAALASLRQSAVPAGFVLLESDDADGNVRADSDGAAFLELAFNDTWQKAVGNVTQYRLRIATAADQKAMFNRITYSGSVQAYGADIPAAFATAAAQASALGEGKLAFPISSSVTHNEELIQTSGGNVFVTVDFNYEYQEKGTRLFLQVTSELGKETFGRTTETVSGFVAAPTLALAQAAYAANVRGLPAYQGALILNERAPSLNQQQSAPDPATPSGVVIQDDRYTFSFTVHRDRDGADTAVQYSLQTSTDIQANKVTTSARGSVFAADEVTASAALAELFEPLALGTLVRSERTPMFELGPAVAGAANAAAGATAFVRLDFSDTYVGVGAFGGLLATSATADTLYAGIRWVGKSLPDGPDVMQNAGTRAGRRTVTAMAEATTESAALSYVQSVRDILIEGTFEDPPRIRRDFKFLEQAAGVPEGASANVMLYVVTGTFEETLPSLGYVEPG